MKAALIFMFTLASAACAAGADTGPPLPPLKEGSATTKLGGPARFGHIVLTPVRIEEDSRCPADVQCVWAGRVRVAVRIEDNGEVLSDQMVMTLGEPRPIAGAGGVAITAVCPYPRQPGPIPKEEYRITFTLGAHAFPRTSDTACPA